MFSGSLTGVDWSLMESWGLYIGLEFRRLGPHKQAGRVTFSDTQVGSIAMASVTIFWEALLPGPLARNVDQNFAPKPHVGIYSVNIIYPAEFSFTGIKILSKSTVFSDSTVQGLIKNGFYRFCGTRAWIFRNLKTFTE